MTHSSLIKSLTNWGARTLAFGGEHCLEVRPRFRIPGAGPVDLLSVRHTSPASPGAVDHFVVGLWSISSSEVDDRWVDAMMRQIHAFEAWYSELLEHAETQGFSPRHRISVSGNLVGRTICRSSLVDMLSSWGAALCFWTWTEAPEGIEVYPYYRKGPALASARGQLKGLLHHLPWGDAAEREEEEEEAKAARPPSLG